MNAALASGFSDLCVRLVFMPPARLRIPRQSGSWPLLILVVNSSIGSFRLPVAAAAMVSGGFVRAVHRRASGRDVKQADRKDTVLGSDGTVIRGLP